MQLLLKKNGFLTFFGFSISTEHIVSELVELSSLDEVSLELDILLTSESDEQSLLSLLSLLSLTVIS